MSELVRREDVRNAFIDARCSDQESDWALRILGEVPNAEAAQSLHAAKLSALRTAQPLTPCPTNHKTSWVPMRGLLSVVPRSWANFWRTSADGAPLITFCPDCGALLDSLADKGEE